MPFESFSNAPQTTLSAAITTTNATTISVTGNGGFPTTGRFRILIDSETMIVTAGQTGLTWTVTRGAEGTIASTHANGATVSHILTAQALYNMNWFDVRAYGAKGDGTTDDTTAIQNAINATDTSAGGIVWFPPATYKTTAALTVTGANSVWLMGGGWGTTIQNTGTGIAIDVGNAVTDQTSDVRILNMVVYGQAGTSHGVRFQRMHSARILGCRIRNHGGDGINFVGSYACWVLDNYVNNNTGWGFHATSVAAAGNDFSALVGNRFLANTAGGIYFNNATLAPAGVRIERNDIEGNAVGIQVDAGSAGNSDGWTIRANYLENQSGFNMALGTDGGATGFLRALLLESNYVGAGSGTHATNAVNLGNVQYVSAIGNAFVSADVTTTANTVVSTWQGNVGAGTTVLPAGYSSAGIPSVSHLRFQDTAVSTQFADMTMANSVVTVNWPFAPLAGVQPGTPANVQQTGTIYMGSGVPSNANGNNGDAYFRTDTPGTANQRLYVKSAGAWTGIV